MSEERSLKLSSMHSGYAADPVAWKNFLECWYRTSGERHKEILQADPEEPFISILEKYSGKISGSAGVRDTSKTVEALEESLGVALPKSYKDFLSAYQPPELLPRSVGSWKFTVGMYAPRQVGRLGRLASDHVSEMEKWPIDSSDSEYFRYGMGQASTSGRTRYARDAIVVGKYSDESYAFVVLYPQVVTADGEMEASLLMHSGEFRAPSFAELMRQLSFLETRAVDSMPPYPQSTLHGTCADKLLMDRVWWD